ncbi:MAG: DUF1223 domain-containing protein [Aquabacterium sp.]
MMFKTLPIVLACMCSAPALAQSCQASSGPQQTRLVELYTSEGCDSCPPADRWLSGLKGRPQVLAAAFHVDYWDRLGWKDRFGDPRHTERQAQTQRNSGARFNYTPQLLVNGRDSRAPDLAATAPPAVVRLSLQREADARVSVRAQPLAGAPARLALWWALLEDDHVSAVKAGENRGVTLRHDHVVRRYDTLPAFASTAPAQWTLAAPASGEGGRRARLLVVATDAATGLPLQALQLDC